MATSGEVSINLSNIGTTINNATTLGDFVMEGVKNQADIIGMAIGLAIALGLLIGLIFLVIGVIPRLIRTVKGIRKV